MEHGEPNGVQVNYGGFIVEDDFIVSPKLSNLSRATFRNMKLRGRRGPQPGCRRYILDNNSPGYGWLLLGWIAEERIVGSGRLYKYYYDPSGRIYRTQYEVLLAWEQSGLVLLDMFSRLFSTVGSSSSLSSRGRFLISGAAVYNDNQ